MEDGTQEVPLDAVAEAFRVLRNDTQFAARMASIPVRQKAAKHEAFRERFLPIAEEFGVEVDALLEALARMVPRPEGHDTRAPRRP